MEHNHDISQSKACPFWIHNRKENASSKTRQLGKTRGTTRSHAMQVHEHDP